MSIVIGGQCIVIIKQDKEVVNIYNRLLPHTLTQIILILKDQANKLYTS